MKLKKRIGAFLLAGTMMTAVGSQAFAAQSMSSWSGYLGANQWTAVSYFITEKDVDSHTHVKWSNSALSARGCKIAVYNENGKQVLSKDVSSYQGQNLPIPYKATKGLQYKLKARLKYANSIGVYNNGTWEP